MRDVIVIGSGGGGPVVAKELAAKGLDVLVIEGGARFADPRNEWTHYEDDANNPITGYLRAGPSQRDLSPWSREFPQAGFMWQIAGVGGTTLHYFGNNPRAPKGLFQGYGGSDAANYDAAHRFPFSFDEFLPYYEWVEQTLPVATAPIGRKEEAYLGAAEKMGLPLCTTKDVSGPSYRPQENAVLQPTGSAGRAKDPSYPEAGGCTLCGHCFQGCMEPKNAPRNLFARRSTDNSYVPMMLTADLWASGGKAATLLTDCTVTKIHTKSVGGVPTATGVTWRAKGGANYTEQAKVVVLAGGCVESPRLWRNSGLPNPNDWVGRGLTDHHPDVVVGVLDHDIGATRGAGSNARIDYPGYGGIEQVCLTPALQAYNFAFSDSGTQGYYDNGGKVGKQGADGVGRLAGKDMLRVMEHADNLLIALIVTDDDVEAQNRVHQSQVYPSDQHGPVPRITIKARQRSARTQRNRQFLAARAAELMRAAGAKEVQRADWPPLVFHPQSSMRMGESASDSVLTSDAEARAVSRLFVADNSALPNAVGGANPTLSTQALATRTAEKIYTRYFGGEAWVKDGTLTTSIDDKVTAGVLARGL